MCTVVFISLLCLYHCHGNPCAHCIPQHQESVSDGAIPAWDLWECACSLEASDGFLESLFHIWYRSVISKPAYMSEDLFFVFFNGMKGY